MLHIQRYGLSMNRKPVVIIFLMTGVFVLVMNSKRAKSAKEIAGLEHSQVDAVGTKEICPHLLESPIPATLEGRLKLSFVPTAST